MSRDRFAQEALRHIPTLLTLLDRNQHSPTYGCFDRNFWHYKIIDFPSGMAQEFVWPLALAYDTNCPENPFYHQSMLREWVAAGIRYAATSAHPDGSCDDYFPFEQASGAAAFSLLACLESYRLLGFNDDNMLDFFCKRADWLANHHESGRLTNHQALISLCLSRLGDMVNTTRWDSAIEQRLERILSWQNPEGWFHEYEGCDPGYHTLTIACLADLYHRKPDPYIKDALERAVRLAAEFVHPDGSYSGEYASRNTYNFFPHGFERVGVWFPEALAINDRFLEGLDHALGPCYADDHILGHHTWSYLLAWREFASERPQATSPPQGRMWLKDANLMIERRENTTLYVALNKGGVFKFFREGVLVASDTQFSLQVQDRARVRNAVGHLIDHYDVSVEENKIRICGTLGWAKQKQMTPRNLMLLRSVMLTVGRFFPNMIRKVLQRMLITGKQNAPYRFTRQFTWENGTWQVHDELYAPDWQPVREVKMGCDQTSIYVVMSRIFQMGQLLPWMDLSESLKQLAPAQPLVLERRL